MPKAVHSVKNLSVRDNRRADIPFHLLKNVIEERMQHDNFHLSILMQGKKPNQEIGKVFNILIINRICIHLYNFIVTAGAKQLFY